MKKETKGKMGKEERKLPSFADDVILHMHNPKAAQQRSIMKQVIRSIYFQILATNVEILQNNEKIKQFRSEQNP